MWKLTTAFVLIAGLMLPTTAGARTEQGGYPFPVSGHQWRVSATLTCQRNSANARVCDELLGPLSRITVDMNMQQNNPTPGITFTATYTATTPPLFPGAGLRPYGGVCAFGLVSSQLRFVRGSAVAFPTCRATVHGRMILRAGVATRMSKTPDFWITSETATVPGALTPLIVDPLGASSYPFDTRIPVVWNAVDRVRGTNRVLGILGIPGFPGQTVLLPAALRASMTIKTIVIMKVPTVGGSGGRNSSVVSHRAGRAAAGTVPCHTLILEGGLVCYSPGAQRLAERQLATQPVNPTGIVEHAIGLRLAQLRLFFGFRGNSGVNLLYGFGQVCWQNEFACSTRYLVVGEAPGPAPFRGPTIVRDRTTSGIGAPFRYGPWKFVDAVPRRNLVISVYGSSPRDAVYRVGMAIVRAAG